MKTVFWLSVVGVLYAYFLYPLLLHGLGRLRPAPSRTNAPTRPEYRIDIIIPVHNEARVLPAKLDNLRELDYPAERLQVIFVSDGSTDETVSLLRNATVPFTLKVVEVSERKGKAHALNQGLAVATGDIVIFSDASIMLERDAINAILQPFTDPAVGCVSGEDHIAGAAGEGLYGRYELFLRNQESALGSIVGASGSFYAERRTLCKPFLEGMAPDFLSVLNTVEQGYRALTEPTARGHMTAVARPAQEFQRKVRTLLRGMTTLFAKPQLLNPFRYGLFALFLISHKLLRWLVPVFLIAALVTNIALLAEPFYLALFVCQAVFYLTAGATVLGVAALQDNAIARVAMFFVMVNLAIFAAWLRYLRGDRQELWTPSERRVP